MPKPVIRAVDDEPEILSSIERDLRPHHRASYPEPEVRTDPKGFVGAGEPKTRVTSIAIFPVDPRDSEGGVLTGRDPRTV